MDDINTKSTSPEIRQALATYTGQSKWMEKSWWDNFLSQRKTYLNSVNNLENLGEKEKRDHLRDWLRKVQIDAKKEFAALWPGSPVWSNPEDQAQEKVFENWIATHREEFRSWIDTKESWWAYVDWATEVKFVNWHIASSIRALNSMRAVKNKLRTAKAGMPFAAGTSASATADEIDAGEDDDVGPSRKTYWDPTKSATSGVVDTEDEDNVGPNRRTYWDPTRSI